MKVKIPADKSLTHRAFIFAGMAEGESTIQTPLLGEDCLSTLKVLQQLGCESTTDGNGTVTVLSPGYAQWKSPAQPLDCGNSGTTARLLLGPLAAIPGLRCPVMGDASLSRRPMRRLTDLLGACGAAIQHESEGDGLPLFIQGKTLSPINCDIPISSAQMKSAMILAALCTPGYHSVRTPKGSRDHTEKFIQFLGLDIKTELTITKNIIYETACINNDKKWGGFSVDIPSDPSSAAFFAPLALFHPKVPLIECENVLSNPTRTGFFDTLIDSGAPIEVVEETLRNSPESVVHYRIHAFDGSRSLNPFHIGPDKVPTLIDEIPILALCAAFANGTSTISGITELRHKESDRLSQTVRLLSAAGIKILASHDELVIHGPTARLGVFEFDTQNDHRLAMCAAILEKLVGSPCNVTNRNCVDISFPKFYETLEGVFT